MSDPIIDGLLGSKSQRAVTDAIEGVYSKGLAFLDPTIALNRALKGGARNLSEGFVEPAKKAFIEASDRVFDRINPALDKVDYIAQNNISRVSKLVGTSVETAEAATQRILTTVDQKYEKVLRETFAEVDKARAGAFADIRDTLGYADSVMEQRITQLSTLAKELFAEATKIAEKFTPQAFMDNLVGPAFDRVERIERQLFQDADTLLSKIDDIITSHEATIRKFLMFDTADRLQVQFSPEFNDCREKLHKTKFSDLSEIDVYRLIECRILSELDRDSIDLQRKLDAYGQLQQNAVYLMKLSRNAPQFNDVFARDWFKYGLLYKAAKKLETVVITDGSTGK